MLKDLRLSAVPAMHERFLSLIRSTSCTLLSIINTTLASATEGKEQQVRLLHKSVTAMHCLLLYTAGLGSTYTGLLYWLSALVQSLLISCVLHTLYMPG